MVIGVFKTCLKCVVINVSNAFFCFYSRNAHSLIFDISHSACCILSKSLVDFKTDITANGHFSADKMILDDFLRNRVAHNITS